MTSQKKNVSRARASGFSMIDVLVAIVVLATALLALAALQGAMTRNAADARARSQVAAYTEGLIDQLRAAGYGNITAGTITPLCTSVATKQQAEACAAQSAAGVSNLSTVVTSSVFYSDPTTGAFSNAVPTTVYGTYDQVRVSSTWTDATGQARQMAFDTIISPVQVDQNNKTLQGKNLLPTSGSTPIVREYNPGLRDGVIPIAMGTTGNSTAATNPQPEILGKNNNRFIGGVSYNVLTFSADDGTSDHKSQITQNIATRVVRCNCKYGAGITTGVFAQPYRPTYWDASQVKYVSPTKTSLGTSTTGVDTTSEFVNGVYSPDQDTNCDVCCRDRNDSATDAIRYNPWNTSDNSHYRYVTTSDTSPTEVLSSDHDNAYVNACRLIIVDGVFAAATDMQNYFFGMVGTDTAAVKKVPSGSTSSNTASSPLPTTAYTADYQNFVIDYLMKVRGTAADLTTGTTLTTANYPLNTPSSPTSGNDAATLFATEGLASGGLSIPTNIDINYVNPGNGKTESCIPTGTQDCRYLHARGLYIDHLEAVTLTAINNAISTCSANTKSALENCVLPLVPFTTINLTQLVDWSEINGTGKTITVTDTALTGGNPDQPLRGVVSALSTGTNNQTSNAKGTVGLSNSGVIGTLTPSGISPIDAATTLDASQRFTLASGGVGNAGALDFNIVLSGGGVGTGLNTPSVSWLGLSTYYTSGSAASTKPCSSGTSPNILMSYVATTTNKCNSQSPNLVTATSVPSGSTAGLQVTVQNYNFQSTGTGGTGVGCSTKQGNATVQPTNTTCSVYQVSSVSVNGTAVPSWSSTLTAGTTSVYGLGAKATITVPSGLSSTSSTTPDLLQIALSADGTNSYTRAYTCTPVGCTGAKGNTCTFKAGACDP